VNPDELTAAIFYRPFRAAWLIDAEVVGSDSDNGLHALSELAQACSRWWEGRNSPLIHVSKEGVSEDARRVLRRHDPDEVIALGAVSKNVIEDVDRIIHPLVFSRPIHVRTPISDADFQVQTIASLPSKINLTKRNESLFSDDLPTLLLFAFGNECPPIVRHFVNLNFGCYAHVIRHQDGKPDFGRGDRLWRDLPHRLYVLANVDDLAAALDEIAGDFQRPGLRFVSPRQFAEGRDDVRPQWPADERYHVFVGDSFEDAELFWHQPIIDGTWRLCSRFRFYLPASLALDPKLQVPLQKWLRRFTNAGSSNHKAPVFVSRSLKQEEIQRIAKHLLNGNKFAIFPGTAEHRDTLQFPPDSADDQRPILLSELERSDLIEIFQVKAQGDTLRVNRPEILREPESGRWMTDVFLQMFPQPRVGRKGDFFWRLPNVRGRDLASAMFRGAARIKTDGYPSVSLGGHRPAITLRTPRPFDVFAMLMRGERSYGITTDLRNELPQPASVRFDIRISDKGQQYRGTIDLFRTLGVAADYFESVLWRQIFRDLASEEASTDAALESRIRDVLNKVYQGVSATQHEKAVGKIMDGIQGRSKEVRLKHSEMDETLRQLRTGPRPFPVEQHIGNAILHDDSACPYDDHTLRNGLTDLMARGVIEAGFEFVCNHCCSDSWLALGKAAQRGECPECGTPWTAEADKPWRYRLASLAKRAVQRSGGAMPVLLAIWRLFVESKGSFLWQPNLGIFRLDHEKGKAPWGELDICCLVDGKFVVGEVKDNIDNFGADDFAKIRKICEAICPDTALLVFMEGEFNAKSSFADRLQELQSQLAPLTTVEWRKVPSRW
jgi:hypothetical protein